jgi:hypothetical protein
MTVDTQTVGLSSERGVARNLLGPWARLPIHFEGAAAMLRSLVVLVSILSCAAALGDELTPAKTADIEKLLEITGTRQTATQMATLVAQQMNTAVKKVRPDIPDKAFDIINAETRALFEEKIGAPGGLVERMVPIYDKYFTHAEIQDMLAFYETGTGKKSIAVRALLIKDGMTIGQQWGESLVPELERRIGVAFKRDGILTSKQ